VPRSRLRRKADFTPPQTRSPQKIGSPPWVAPLMVTLFVLGLLWIVVFYIAGQDIPLMSDLGNLNLAVGFGFIAAGFVVSTQWR